MKKSIILIVCIIAAHIAVGQGVGIGTTTPHAPLQFSNVPLGRKIVLYEGNNNDHQYFGLGVDPNTLRYQVMSISDNHVFYAAPNSLTSNELMRIQGNGNVGIGINNAQNMLDIRLGTSRTGSHVTGRTLYVTGDILDSSNGFEFRHNNGLQGIGFGYNTIYATGSLADQNLGIKAKGTTGNLILSTNEVERMRVTGDGKVGIGTTNPHSSSIMEIQSTTKGVLLPRMTTEQRNAIVTPASGLMILNLDDQCIDIYHNNNWIKNCGMKVTASDTLPESWKERTNFGGGVRSDAVILTFSNVNRIYMGTGADPAYKKDFWEYDPSTNVWTQKADFGGSPRARAVGFTIEAGYFKGYIGTGFDGTFKNDFWEYNPLTNIWVEKNSLPEHPRADAVGFTLGLKGYIGTGRTFADELLEDIYEYDPSSGSWLQKNEISPLLSVGLRNAVVIPDGSGAYIGTGYIIIDEPLIGYEGETANFWRFDPASGGSWTGVANFGGGARINAIACGKYVGTGSQNGTLKNDMWKYTTTGGGSWTQVSNFPGTARQDAVGCSLLGRNFICGGNDGAFKNDLWEYIPYPLGPVYNTSQSLTEVYSINDAIWTRENQKIYNSNNGNVGIGTPNPTTKLEVAGTFKVSGTVMAPLKFDDASANRKMVLWNGTNNEHQYFGFGTNDMTLRYQVSNVNDNHVFYAATSPSTSNELMRIKGNGNLTVAGIIESEPFILPTLDNGFTNYGGEFAAAAYYKDEMGIVHLRGLINKVGEPDDLNIFTLPVGYRPSTSGRLIFCTNNNEAFCRVDVVADGVVKVAFGAPGYISLDNISFRAD